VGVGHLHVHISGGGGDGGGGEGGIDHCGTIPPTLLLSHIHNKPTALFTLILLLMPFLLLILLLQ
jgi:hypothetical protein